MAKIYRVIQMKLNQLVYENVRGRWKRKYWKTQVWERQVRNSAFRKDGKRVYGKRKYNANLQSDK